MPDPIPPEALLADFAPPIRALADELRAIVAATVPGVVERVRPGWRIIGFDAPVGRKTRYFAWVFPERVHVHLGFVEGVLMDDPDRRMDGEGETKKARWLTWTPGDSIDADEVAAFVREGARRRRDVAGRAVRAGDGRGRSRGLNRPAWSVRCRCAPGRRTIACPQASRRVAMTTDFTIELVDRPGTLARASDALGRAGVNIEGACGFATDGHGVFHVLVRDGERARRALLNAGFEIQDERTVVVHPIQNKPGEAAGLLRRVADAGVNLDILYTTLDGQIVLGGDDVNAIRRAVLVEAVQPVAGEAG